MTPQEKAKQLVEKYRVMLNFDREVNLALARETIKTLRRFCRKMRPRTKKQRFNIYLKKTKQ